MLTTHRTPITLYGLNPIGPKSIDVDFIREFFEYLDFSAEYNDFYDPVSYSASWQFFIFSTSCELDEAYDFVDSHEGRKIHPKRNSICQLLLDVFGSDIRENLTASIVDHIWCYATSLRFLKWFMASTDSETLTVCKETGRSPILKLFVMWDIYHLWAGDVDLVKDKFEFLVRKGAPLHYSANRLSITAWASRTPRRWVLWCFILLELKVDLPSFFNQEIIQGACLGLKKATLLTLSSHFHFIVKSWDKYKWDAEFLCSNCEGPVATFWKFYLKAIQRLSSPRKLSESDEISDDDDGTSEERHISASEGVEEGNDVNEGDDVDEAYGCFIHDFFTHDNSTNEFLSGFVDHIYKDYSNRRDIICRRCNEASKLMDELQSSQPPMPGRFIP